MEYASLHFGYNAKMAILFESTIQLSHRLGLLSFVDMLDGVVGRNVIESFLLEWQSRDIRDTAKAFIFELCLGFPQCDEGGVDADVVSIAPRIGQIFRVSNRTAAGI